MSENIQLETGGQLPGHDGTDAVLRSECGRTPSIAGVGTLSDTDTQESVNKKQEAARKIRDNLIAAAEQERVRREGRQLV